MTREEQAKKSCAIIVSDDMEIGTPYAAGYNKGIETGVKWADNNPKYDKIIKFIEEGINSIESGNLRVSCEYSWDTNLMKAFNDGQISALNLIKEYLKYKNI